MGSVRSPRAVLILDIDGNLNPYYARHTLADRPERLPGFEECTFLDPQWGAASVFLQANELRVRFRELREAGVELLWGSAWNENSNLIIRMLFPDSDFEDAPIIVFPEEIEFSLSVQTWKLSTVERYIKDHYEDSVPLIWTDDEVFEDGERWVHQRPGSGLVIRPERHTGLRLQDWESIAAFVAELER